MDIKRFDENNMSLFQSVDDSDLIYDNTNVNKYNKIKNKLAKKRFLNKNHNIVNYNLKNNRNDNDSVFSDDETIMKKRKMKNKKMHTLSDCEEMTNNRKYENKILNNYKEQFDDLAFDNTTKPVSMNNINKKRKNRKNAFAKLAFDNGFSKFDNNDMRYHVTNDMSHNNMVPYFSNKTYGYGLGHEQKMMEYSKRNIDTFTGTLDNLEYRKKLEAKPLFNPLTGITNINGLPVMTSFFDSYYIPSKERNGERPFQQTRVTPGLDLPYNAIGRQGYVDTYRPPQYTVDDLRTANNPKSTYKGVIIPGQKGSRGPIASEVKKHKPERFKEYGDERMLPTRSYWSAPSIHGEYDQTIMATENRGKYSTPYYGAGKFYNTQITPSELLPLNKIAEKQNYIYAGPRNVQLVGGLQNRESEKTYNPKMTQRMNVNKYIGQLNGNEKSYAFDKENNIPNQTMRNIYENNNHIGVINNSQINKNYAFSYNENIPNSTMRNLYENNNIIGNFGNSDLSKPKVFDMNNNIPSPTIRNITEQNNYIGNVGTNETDKLYVFDYKNNIPTQTMRNIYELTDRAGIIGRNGKSYIFDKENNIPEQTMRNISENNDRAGIIGRNGKSYTFDKENNIPEQTMRNISENNDRAGIIGRNGKSYAFDKENNIPEQTMRNISENNDRAGIVGRNGKSYAFDKENNIPEQTMRNIHEKTDRTGIVGRNGKSYAFDKENNIPEQTMRNIHEKTDRTGIVGRNGKSYAFDKKNNIPEYTMRNIHEKTDRTGIVGRNGKSYAFDKENNVPEYTMRNLYENNKYIGVAESHKTHRTRDDVNNARLNTAKERISKGRAPTLSNYNKGPITDFTAYELKNEIIDNRAQIPSDIPQIGRANRKIKYKNTLPNREFSFLSYIDDNLKGNPYVLEYYE